MLGNLSTAGGAECTLEMQESQSKFLSEFFLSAQPAKCGEASFPGVPGLVSCGGVVGLEVQRAGQGGQCGQWQAHSHPMREPKVYSTWLETFKRRSTLASVEQVLVCECSHGCPRGSGRWLCGGGGGLMAEEVAPPAKTIIFHNLSKISSDTIF